MYTDGSELIDYRERNADGVGEDTTATTKGEEKKKRRKGVGHGCKGVTVMMDCGIYAR